ncbi:MAG TPA: tRNA (adenosine(37)-N6)-threonylcarbamoyltransferase complex dimerization subunit type 1 TsaB [Clostridiales bacterium]|nr:tRNA (adenosine(37)-N6)-threonylcarbamoyltransferase complex dimerization subunit type 1 TsaB [Clostridiales bacterium]
MTLLAIESSARVCSVAIVKDEKLLCELFSDSGLTHSKTLMKMIDDAFSFSGIDFAEIDSIAVALGPGSYTGVRIGISCVKGLAHPNDIPCYGVSTLEAMAYNFLGINSTVCSVMDARCEQVYAGIFSSNNSKIVSLSGDMALPLNELIEKLDDPSLTRPIFLIGDGSDLVYSKLTEEQKKFVFLSPLSIRLQRAGSVAQAVFNNEKIELLRKSYKDLNPVYLRPSQAERNLKRS